MDMSEKDRLEQETTQTTFKFNKQTLAVINQLKKDFGATSKAEVIRKALALLEMAQNARQNGDSLAIVGKDGKPRNLVVL
jgi:hypothetical protein